jgi:hypothetical protein
LSAVSIEASASSRPMNKVGTRIGTLDTAYAPGTVILAGASRFDMNSRKRFRFSSSDTPYSSQRLR